MKKLDYTGGDNSFKNWFSIMWKNFFIQFFIIFTSMLVAQIINFDWCIEAWYEAVNEGTMPAIMVSIAMCLPSLGVFIISYKAFYQFWNDLKNGNSR